MKKRLLCMILTLCMVLTLLPSMALAAGNTITPASNTLEALRTAINSAQNGDTVQLTGDITTSSDLLQFITVSKAVTLDFAGFTINYNGTGTDINTTSGLFYIASGGILTLKGSGGVALSGNYSAMVQVNSGGKIIIDSGTYTNTAATDGSLITSLSGTVEINGGTLSTKSFQPLVISGGTCSISNGSVSSDTYALVSLGGAVTISSGTVSSSANTTVYVTSGGSVQMTGGTIENTGSGIALNLQASAKASTLSGGSITAVSNFGVFSAGELTVEDGAVISSDSGVGMRSDGTLTFNGGSVSSKSGVALANAGSMTMVSGTVSSDSNCGLINASPAGKSATVSGGSVTSGTSYPVLNFADGTLNINGGSVTTTNGSTAVYNYAAGTVNVTGGTLSAKTATIINNGAGTIKFSAGTIDSIVNFNASGSIVIDGGSVKTIQGATPKNSAGTALRQYPIQITGKQNTPITNGELTFTPAVAYSFAGVTTDASGLVYLWLPEKETSAVYKTGNEDAKSGGLADTGKTTVLPNFTATVKLYIDNNDWTGYSSTIMLSEKSTSSFVFAPENGILPDGGSGTDGVFTFSGLDESKSYYIWTPDIIGTSCVGTAAADVLTKSNLSARVDYYTVTLTKGTGIASANISFNPLRKGTSAGFSATFENGYKFEHWLKTGTSEVFGTDMKTGISNISAPLNLTAVGTLNVYDATVTLNKDNAAWTDNGKAIVLSPSSTNVAAEGAKTETASGASVSFTALDPRVTYYVWADGAYTGQTITNNTTAATLDYYTVTAVAGANIDTVTINGSGSSLTVLKGGSATIAATAKTGDYVFSRWNDAAGALYSTTAETTISNTTAPMSLTAVGASTTYTAAVTVNKDGAPWTASPHKIVLSSSATECGDVVGTLNNGVYSFSKLPGANTYYIWDAETVTYTGQSISAGESTSKVTLDYYTVSVTNNGGSNITAVTGTGVYLAGSTVTVTATPAQHYKIKWNDGSTASSMTISSLFAKTDLSVTAELDVYTGTVTVQKDSTTWAAFTGSISLSTDKGDSAAGKLTGSNTNGVVSFTNLDPRVTYYVWADGVYTGQTPVGKTATVKYYTVSVTATGVDAISNQIVLAGKDASFTAVPINGYDFTGWYDADGKLLSTTPAFTLTGVTKATTLFAKASNTFDAVITVNGATGRTITLQSGSDTAINPSSGTSFTNLDRTKTYKVLDGGVDTGFTVCKNAPNVTLQYYSVALTRNTGVGSVSGDGTYLAGSSVTISATATTGYAFSGWNGTVSSTSAAYTIAAIDKDYTLTASAALSFTGTVSVANGSIEICDSDTTGKIAIKQAGSVMENANALDPNTNITITGTSTGTNDVLISATRGVYVTLNGVDITRNGDPALKVTSTAGTVVLDLQGTNILKAQNGTNSRAALNKGNTESTLIIQSTGGQGSLEATGYGSAAGIGGNFAETAKNITINSGIIKAIGGDGSSGGAGIGGGFYDVGKGMVENLVINGGTITAIGGNSTSTTTGVTGAMGIGFSATRYSNLGGSITINGGTIIATSGAVTSSGITAPGIGVSGGGSLTINGGTITSTSGIFSGAVVTGGNIDCGTATVNAKNAKGEFVYKTTFTAGSSAGTDVSTALVIRDKNGTTYGMKDVKTFDSGAVYAYLPADTAGATYNGDKYAANVIADGTGVFTKITAGTAFTVSVPASATTEGVTATGTLQQVMPQYAKGATVTINVTLSGTALKPGTYTVGITGTSAGTITPPATVTKAVAVGDSPTDKYTFTFTMPETDVSDLAVTLSFTENTKYTVAYSATDATGGSVPAGGSYYAGQTYTVDSSDTQPTRTGYTFAGWSTDGITKITGSQNIGTANVTLKPVWQANTYTVTFHANSGTGSMSAQQFTYGAAAAALTQNSFTRTGYTFAGWAATSGGAKVYSDKDSITVSKDTDLYALWTPKVYTVTFNNGGGMGTMNSQSFSHDAAQDLTPNAFTRTGYVFAGWKDTSNAAYQNGASYKTTGDMTLTAQWMPITYSVKFSANGGTGSIGDQSFTYDATQNLTSNTITRTGYTFAGWNTKDDGKGTSYADSASVKNLTAVNGADVKLYAVWTANTYTVKFDKNSDDATGTLSDQTLTYDTAAKLTQNTAIIRKGYTFAGWNTAKDGGGIPCSDKANVKNLTAAPNETVTLYAMWTADVYTITFAANGGTGTMANQIFATGNTAAIRANAFTKAGYSFNGWKDDKNASVAENATVDTVGRTATLSAQWTANTYTVAFYANGGTGNMSDQQFTYDASAAALTKNTFTRTGYKFLGWSDTPTATVASYSDQQSVSNLTAMKDGSVTLYAVWQSNTYKVSFISNGGAGSMEDLPVTNGMSAILNTNIFKRDGYKFSGWNTSADGSGTYYPDGATVSFTPDSTGMVFLYAVWTQSTRYNLSGTVKDNTDLVSGADVTLKKGGTVIASTKTNASGAYSINNILPGLYNLVITKGDKTITIMVTVTTADVEENVILPSAETKNSLLVVNSDTGATVPSVVVGGLDTVAKTADAGITMTVTAKAEEANNIQQTAIKTVAGSQKLAQFLDITLKKGTDDIGSSNTTVLEIVQPFSFSGKTDVTVLRYHGGSAEKLKKLGTKPTSSFEDGTYFADSQNGLLYIYAEKFSTYAVSYQEVISSSGGGTSSTSYSITVNSSENGTVKTDKVTASTGEKVTVTVTPNAGYTTESLSVMDADGKIVSNTDHQNGTFTFAMPNSNVTVSAKFLKQSGNPFIDVSDTAYYYDAVLWAVDKGITTGTTATTFTPDATCTRAQTVTFLWRSMGSPEPTSTSCPFTDVAKDSYYYKAVLWATEKGITLGTSSTTFSPGDTVTRGQTVTFLWRTAGKSAATATNPFGDVKGDDYYLSAVLWAVSKSITTGTSASTFSPIDGCTRAQIVTFLYRYLSK